MKMKKIFSALFIFCLIILNAQNYKIMRSATGELFSFAPVWDGEQLYGYLEIHKEDLSKDNIQTYKYMIIDRNMNKVSDGTFQLKIYVGNSPRLDTCFYNAGKIVISVKEYNASSFLRNEVLKIIDLQNNTVSEDISMQDGKLINPKDAVFADPQFKIFNDGMSNYRIKNQGILMMERDVKGMNTTFKNGWMLDMDGKPIWKVPTIEGETKDHYYEYGYFGNDENTIMLLAQYSKRKKFLSNNFLLLNAKTGEKIALKSLMDAKYIFSFEEAKFVDDKIYFVGEYYEKESESSIAMRIEKKLGLYQMVIDKNTGEELSRKYLPFTEMGKFADINANGRIKKEGILIIRNLEIRPDGYSVIAAETYRPENFVMAANFPEFFSILLSPDFKVEKMQSYNTSTTLGSKYSYTQQLSKNKGSVTIFLDNENRQLSLNALIYKDEDHSFKVEKLELEKKDSDLSFFPAKNGYIGLIEYFKKSKTEDRLAELRLEKLDVD